MFKNIAVPAQVAVGLVALALILFALWGIYHKGQQAAAPKVAAAQGETLVATTQAANTEGAMKAASEKHVADTKYQVIYREAAHAIETKKDAGDWDGVTDAWAHGIDGMRSCAANASSCPDVPRGGVPEGAH